MTDFNYNAEEQLAALRNLSTKEEAALRMIKKDAIERMIRGEISADNTDEKERINEDIRLRFTRILEMKKQISSLEKSIKKDNRSEEER